MLCSRPARGLSQANSGKLGIPTPPAGTRLGGGLPGWQGSQCSLLVPRQPLTAASPCDLQAPELLVWPQEEEVKLEGPQPCKAPLGCQNNISPLSQHTTLHDIEPGLVGAFHPDGQPNFAGKVLGQGGFGPRSGPLSAQPQHCKELESGSHPRPQRSSRLVDLGQKNCVKERGCGGASPLWKQCNPWLLRGPGNTWMGSSGVPSRPKDVAELFHVCLLNFDGGWKVNACREQPSSAWPRRFHEESGGLGDKKHFCLSSNCGLAGQAPPRLRTAMCSGEKTFQTHRKLLQVPPPGSWGVFGAHCTREARTAFLPFCSKTRKGSRPPPLVPGSRKALWGARRRRRPVLSQLQGQAGQRPKSSVWGRCFCCGLWHSVLSSWASMKIWRRGCPPSQGGSQWKEKPRPPSPGSDIPCRPTLGGRRPQALRED